MSASHKILGVRYCHFNLIAASFMLRELSFRVSIMGRLEPQLVGAPGRAPSDCSHWPLFLAMHKFQLVYMLNLNKLTDDERDQFMGLIHDSLSINTHFELLRWLRGSLQQHLPHDIFIAAWGDFPSGPIYHDVISELPGIRTRKISDDDLVCFLTRLFTYWESNGCAPSQLGSKELTNLKGDIECEVLAQNVGKMKSVLVHAIKDFRGRNYCLYVLLSRAKTNPRRSCAMFQALLPHIDASLRKVPHLPEQAPDAALIGDLKKDELACLPGITAREAEIMRLVRIGKTNIEIGMILDISAFTVKNHLKHIFQKLNVNNRAQAVSKF